MRHLLTLRPYVSTHPYVIITRIIDTERPTSSSHR